MDMLGRVAEREVKMDISVWSTDQCLVAPRSLSRFEAFGAARSRIAELGMPLHLRVTGGDIAPQGPGILNVTVTFVPARVPPPRIDDVYRKLCRPILEYLASRGVAPRCGQVPGAFCDGAHNVVVGRRKLAGTAQRWRMRTGGEGEASGFAVLAHASIQCYAKLDAFATAANAFYVACGLRQRIRPERHLAMFDLPGFAAERRHPAEGLDALARELTQRYRLEFDPN